MILLPIKSLNLGMNINDTTPPAAERVPNVPITALGAPKDITSNHLHVKSNSSIQLCKEV